MYVLQIRTLEDMENDESIGDLLKPKFLNCPAIFKVEHLKKFIVSKFLINSSRFNVEISYKVKTIVLPEHYTLMDVAYIYTWKKVRFESVLVEGNYAVVLWDTFENIQLKNNQPERVSLDVHQ